jgi:hypothetical protein
VLCFRRQFPISTLLFISYPWTAYEHDILESLKSVAGSSKAVQQGPLSALLQGPCSMNLVGRPCTAPSSRPSPNIDPARLLKRSQETCPLAATMDARPHRSTEQGGRESKSRLAGDATAGTSLLGQ